MKVGILKKERFEEFLREGSITFISWECPPRQIIEVDGKPKVRFCVDLERVFEGEKLDAFTELPKCVQYGELENLFFSSFLKKYEDVKINYVKLIADTNAYYVYPQSMLLESVKEIKKCFSCFRKRICEWYENNFKFEFEWKVELFTSFLREDAGEIYKGSMKEVEKFLPTLKNRKIFLDLLRDLKGHIGLGFRKGEEALLRRIAENVVKTYAAEGMVFFLLEEKGILQNLIWLNFDEPYWGIEFTNLLRRKNKLPLLPQVRVRW